MPPFVLFILMWSFGWTCLSWTLLPWPILCHWGKFCIQRLSNTLFARTIFRSNFGSLLLEWIFGWHFGGMLAQVPISQLSSQDFQRPVFVILLMSIWKMHLQIVVFFCKRMPFSRWDLLGNCTPPIHMSYTFHLYDDLLKCIGAKRHWNIPDFSLLQPISQHSVFGQRSVYIYAVGSITWPYFGQSRVNNLAMVGSITWPSFFEPIKIGVFGDFLVHSFQGVVQN